jgi:hypothetical protein
MTTSADAATTVVYTSSAAEQATNVSVWYADTLTATARDWRAVTGPPPCGLPHEECKLVSVGLLLWVLTFACR